MATHCKWLVQIPILFTRVDVGILVVSHSVSPDAQSWTLGF